MHEQTAALSAKISVKTTRLLSVLLFDFLVLYYLSVFSTRTGLVFNWDEYCPVISHCVCFIVVSLLYYCMYFSLW